MRQIGFQQLLDGLRRVFRLEVVVNLLPDIGVGAEPAAREQMIAFDGVVLFANGDFGGDQTYIADVMLRAGMVTAGKMDVQRRVEYNPRLAPVADLGAVALGIGRRELAAGIAGTGNQPGADLRCLDRQSDRLNSRNSK